MLSNNKFLGKCWYGGQPWIRLAMERESMVEKGITLFFVWEPPMAYLAWKTSATPHRLASGTSTQKRNFLKVRDGTCKFA